MISWLQPGTKIPTTKYSINTLTTPAAPSRQVKIPIKKPRHASERGQVKSAWFIKHYVSAKISKFTAKIAPERVLLLCIKGVDDILARRRGIFIKAFHFGRRILQIVIHGNDMLAF